MYIFLSKYRVNICPAVGSTGEISVHYELSLCFLGVPRDINFFLLFRLWKKGCGKHRSGLRNRDSIPGVGEVFMFLEQRLALRSTQPPVQCVPGGPYFARANQPGHGAHHSLSCSAEGENTWSSTSSFIRVIILCLTKSRCQLTCTFTTKLRSLVDASDVCGSHMSNVRAPVNISFYMVESGIFCAGY